MLFKGVIMPFANGFNSQVLHGALSQIKKEFLLMEIALGIILMIGAIFLIAAVLMQSGKSHKLSGTIAGGAETFFGKTKGKSIDKLFSKLTTIVSVVFVVLVIVVYIFQDKPIEDAKNDALDDALGSTEVTEEDAE